MEEPAHMPTAPACRRSRGFSLTELLIALAIVGVLASIAMPSYREHLRKGAMEEVTASLATGRVAIEQFYLDNRSYEDAPCPAGTEHFSVACDSDASTYTLTATGSGLMAGFVLTLDETDARTTAGPWGAAACWLSRKGDAC
jgi:type IV pilus assembly protein PilE